MNAVICSRNAHKARELERLLPGWTIAPLDRDDYPPETRETYYENAAIKARFGRAHADGFVLAEDSGLEVDALGGRPGVHSARYAPEGAPAIAKLLGELEGVTGRNAHYTSELVLLAPDSHARNARGQTPGVARTELTEYRGTGTLTGRIATQPSGAEGFGYDPVFIPDGETLTVAELGNDWKALNSHRARAARALLRALAGAPATTS